MQEPLKSELSDASQTSKGHFIHAMKDNLGGDVKCQVTGAQGGDHASLREWQQAFELIVSGMGCVWRRPSFTATDSFSYASYGILLLTN